MFAPGVWGPYYSVGVPEFWTNEGGQSLAGKLVSLRVALSTRKYVFCCNCLVFIEALSFLSFLQQDLKSSNLSLNE